MKIEVDVDSLADAVAWTTKIIDIKASNPILSGLKLKAEDNTLSFSSYNTFVSTQHSISADIAEEGTILVRGKLLADIVRALPAEKVTLFTEKNLLVIVSGKSRFTMQLMSVDDYPDLPALPQKIGQIDGDTFIHTVNQVAVAASQDKTHSVLNCINILINSQEMYLIATDRFRVARRKIYWSAESDDIEANIVINASMLKEISRSLNEKKNVQLYYDVNNPHILGIENDNRIVTVQVMDSEYPRIDFLFQQESNATAVVDRKKLLDSIRRMSLVTDRNSNVTAIFEHGEIRLTAGVADSAQAYENFSVIFDGLEQTVLYKFQYIIDALSVIDEPFVCLELSTKTTTLSGQEDETTQPIKDFQYVVVPARKI